MAKVLVELCVGMFDCEWYFWARTVVNVNRVPCIGERLSGLPGFENGQYTLVDAVYWEMGIQTGEDIYATPTVSAEYDVGGKTDLDYLNNIKSLLHRFQEERWDCEVPEDVFLEWAEGRLATAT